MSCTPLIFILQLDTTTFCDFSFRRMIHLKNFFKKIKVIIGIVLGKEAICSAKSWATFP
jgi:hypothetical protein